MLHDQFEELIALTKLYIFQNHELKEKGMINKPEPPKAAAAGKPPPPTQPIVEKISKPPAPQVEPPKISAKGSAFVLEPIKNAPSADFKMLRNSLSEHFPSLKITDHVPEQTLRTTPNAALKIPEVAILAQGAGHMHIFMTHLARAIHRLQASCCIFDVRQIEMDAILKAPELRLLIFDAALFGEHPQLAAMPSDELVKQGDKAYCKINIPRYFQEPLRKADLWKSICSCLRNS
jgi:hypothetical protein